MNELVQQFRANLAAKGKTSDKTDRELTVIIGNALRQKGDFDTEQKYPEFRQQYLDYTQATDRGMVGEVVAGVKRGYEGLKSTVFGAAALGLDAIGADETAAKVAAKAKEIGENAGGDNAPTIERMGDIQDVGDAVRYLAGKAGEVTPSLAEAIATGVVGAMIGSTAAPGPGTIGGAATGFLGKTAIKTLIRRKAIDLTEEAAEAALKAGTNKALETAVKNEVRALVGAAATGANSLALSSGEIYNETGEVGLSLGAGAIAAVPDTIVPAMVIRRLFKVAEPAAEAGARTFIGRLLTEASKTAPIEAGTEAFQQLVSIAAGKYSRGEPASLTSSDWEQLREAAVGGAVGGTIAAPLAAAPTPQNVANETRQQANEKQKQANEEARRRAAVSTAVPDTTAQTAARTNSDVRISVSRMTDTQKEMRLTALEKIQTPTELEKWELGYLRAVLEKPAPLPPTPAPPAATAATPAPAAPAAAALTPAPVVTPNVPVTPAPAPMPAMSAGAIRQQVQILTKRLTAISRVVDTSKHFQDLAAIAATVPTKESLKKIDDAIAEIEVEARKIEVDKASKKASDLDANADLKRQLAESKAKRINATVTKALAALAPVEQPTPAPAPAPVEVAPAPALPAAPNAETLGEPVVTVTPAKPIAFGELSRGPEFSASFMQMDPASFIERGVELEKDVEAQIRKRGEDNANEGGFRTHDSSKRATRIAAAFWDPKNNKIFLRGVLPVKTGESLTGSARPGVIVQSIGTGKGTATRKLDVAGTQPVFFSEVVSNGLIPIARLEFQTPGKIKEDFASYDEFVASVNATKLAEKVSSSVESARADAMKDVAELEGLVNDEARKKAAARSIISRERRKDRTAPMDGNVVASGDAAVAAAEAATAQGGRKQMINSTEGGDTSTAQAEVRKVLEYGPGPWTIRTRPVVGKWVVASTVSEASTPTQIKDAYGKAQSGMSSGYVQIVDANGDVHATLKKTTLKERTVAPIEDADAYEAFKLLDEGGWIESLLKQPELKSAIRDFLSAKGPYKSVYDGRKIGELLGQNRAGKIEQAVTKHESYQKRNRREVAGRDGSKDRKRGTGRRDAAPSGGAKKDRGTSRVRKTAGGTADARRDSGSRSRRGPRASNAPDGIIPAVAERLGKLYKGEAGDAGLIKLHDFIISGGEKEGLGVFSADVMGILRGRDRDSLNDAIADLLDGVEQDFEKIVTHFNAAITAADGSGEVFAAILRGLPPPELAKSLLSPGLANKIGILADDVVTEEATSSGFLSATIEEADGTKHEVFGRVGGNMDGEVRMRTITDALIAIRPEMTPEQKILADALIALGMETTVHWAPMIDSAGTYNPATDAAAINQGLSKLTPEYVETVLHEALHAATIAGLTLDPAFAKDVAEIRAELLAKVSPRLQQLAAQLDVYDTLGDATDTRRILERLSSSDSSGGEAGTARNIQEIRAVARGSHRPGQTPAQRSRAEESAIREWARSKGLIADNAAFDAEWTAQGSFGGQEHDVYKKGRRWYKRNTLQFHNGIVQYLSRLAFQNDLFPEAPVRLEGFAETAEGLRPIISQEDVTAERGATRAEVEAHMGKLGFKRITEILKNGEPRETDDYIHPDGLKVEDLHAENALIFNGRVIVIDPVVYMLAKPVQSISESDFDFKLAYALSSDAELIAGLSDPRIVSWLRSQTVTSGTFTNAWQWLVSSIKRLLGLDEKQVETIFAGKRNNGFTVLVGRTLKYIAERGNTDRADFRARDGKVSQIFPTLRDDEPVDTVAALKEALDPEAPTYGATLTPEQKAAASKVYASKISPFREMDYTESMARVQSAAWNEILPDLQRLHMDLMPAEPFEKFWRMFNKKAPPPKELLDAAEARVPGSSTAAINGDGMTEPMNDRAAYVAYSHALRISRASKLLLAMQREQIQKTADKLIAESGELAKAERSYMDADAVNARMMDKLKAMIAETAKDTDRLQRGSTSFGALTQAIKDAEGIIKDGPIPAEYQRVLAKVMDSDGVVIFDHLNAIAALALPDGTKVMDVLDAMKASGNEPLVNLATKQRPLAIALASLASTSGRDMRLLRLRVLRDAAESVAIKRELDEIRTANDARLEQMWQEIVQTAGAKSLSDQLRSDYIEIRRNYRRAMTNLKKAELRERVLDMTHTRMEERATELSKLVGNYSYFELSNGVSYWAMSRDQDGEWIKTKRTLKMIGNEITDQHAQVSNDMAGNRLWLDAHPNDKGTRFYQEILRQTEKVSMVDLSRKYAAANRWWMDKLLLPIGKKFEQMGGITGRRINQMLIQFQTITKFNEDRVSAASARWSKAMDDASKAAGFDYHKLFFQQIYDPVIYQIESSPGLDEQAALREAVRAAKRRIPEGQKVAEDFGEKFRVLMVRTKEMSEMMLGIAESNGVFIQDKAMRDPLNKKAFLLRNAIKYGWLTVPRRMRADVVNHLVKDMKELGWSSGMFESLSKGEATAEEMVSTYFTPEVITRFVIPFVMKPGAEVFSGAEAAGKVVPVSQVMAQNAWDSADGDVLGFIRGLFEMTYEPTKGSDSDAAYEAYELKMLNRFADLYNMEQAIAIQSQPDSRLFDKIAGNQAKAHRLMDGRHNDLIPPDHFGYDVFDPVSARVGVAEIAFHAAFGRDAVGLREMLTALEGELDGKIVEYKHIVSKHRTGAARREAARAMGIDFGEAERAFKDKQRIEGMSKEIAGFFDKGNQSGGVGDAKLLLEFLQLQAGLILNQPKSGLMNLVSLADFPTVLGGGSFGLRGTGIALKNLATSAFGSALEAVNINILRASDYMAEVTAMVEGSEMQRQQWGTYIADPGRGGSFQDGIQQRGIQAIRGVQKAIRKGVKTSEGGKFAHLTPLAPFQWISHQASISISMANVQNFELMIVRAIKFFADNPDLANDPSYRLTAKDLGMDGPAYFTDEKAFEFYRSRAIDYDVGNIEDIARAAAEKRARGDRLLTKYQVLAITTMALNEISLESGINSRPIEFHNNPIIRYGGMLLGWPLMKVNQVNQSLKTPDGRKTARSVLQGLGVMAAWSLPVALAYSLLMDEYDEEVLGKKSNMRGIDNIAVIPVVGPALAMAGAGDRSSKDNMLGILERASRMGNVYGIGADFISSLVGYTDPTAGQRAFDLNSRVLAFSQYQNFVDAVRAWYHGEEATYDGVVKPLFMAMGGNGVIHAQQTINNMLDLDNNERWVAERTNVGNWLRAAGREVGIELRAGAGRTSPTPMSVQQRKMYLSALANDRAGFLDAYRKAIAVAREKKEEDPEATVLASWKARHPYMVFNGKQTDREISELMSVMSDDGRQAVRESIRLYDQFTEMIEPSIAEQAMKREIRRMKPKAAPTIEDLRRRAALR